MSFVTQSSVASTGRFTSAKLMDPEHTLPFIRNPHFGGLVTPFMQNVTHNYGVEFSLEQRRVDEFASYPSRMASIFLFYTLEIAEQYAALHPDHVADRTLQRVKSVGDYVFSEHDSSWIDYMRIPHFWRPERVDDIARNYWQGTASNKYTLTSYGVPWTGGLVPELLYTGSVEFYDTSWAPEPSIGAARVLPHEPSEEFRQFLETQTGIDDAK